MMTVAKAELTEEDEEEINVEEEEEEEEEVEEGGRVAEDLRKGVSCNNGNLPQTSDNFGLAASQRRKQRR